MIKKYNGWEFTRQLGIGEREHVRSQLLGVGFFYHKNIVEQLEGACQAADTLGMMLRAHVNFDRIETPNKVYALFRDRYAQHQLEDWKGLDRAKFDSMCKKLEIMIVEDVYADHSNLKETVQVGVLNIWAASGGRFLKGNFALKTDAELRYVYPDMYHSTDRFWDAWNA